VRRTTRSQVIELADVFRANDRRRRPRLDHDRGAGDPEKLEAMVELLEPFGIREMVRSGTHRARPRLASITDGSKVRMQRVV
jgi:acetolactate synthase I/III small subunit